MAAFFLQQCNTPFLPGGFIGLAISALLCVALWAPCFMSVDFSFKERKSIESDPIDFAKNVNQSSLTPLILNQSSLTPLILKNANQSSLTPLIPLIHH
ncbi:hypothetical protein V8J88_17505 [Massilia sp. W12]|uniref:hypothetical protein n=1 Tax=Massilia sp. W12 TaxID=3126507 RepID=UPI0030CF65B7